LKEWQTFLQRRWLGGLDEHHTEHQLAQFKAAIHVVADQMPKNLSWNSSY